MKRGLRGQITLTIAAITLFGVALITVLANILIQDRFEGYVARRNAARTADIVSNLGHQYDAARGRWNADAIHSVGMYALYDGYIIKVYDTAGNLVWDAENHDMTLCRHMMEEVARRMEARRPGGEFVSREYPLTGEGGDQIGTVSIRYYGPYFFSEDDFQFLDGLNAILAAAGAVSLALSIVAGGMLARRIARPVAKAADIAKQIARGNYDIRFEGRPHARELEDLAGAINHLAGVLAEQENLRKRLTTDVAHELRTPLTALGLHLEAMLEGVWEPTPERLASCYEEIARLTKLISDLEQLAGAQPENLRLDRAQVDLLDVARGVIRAFEKELHDKGLELELEGEACVVYADRGRLSQVMTNLLSNAVKYSKPGGHIRVEVRDEGQVALLAVEDDGIGITATELPFLFERFYRTDKSRSRDTGGAGIGLAIAKAIVQAHGGSIRAESREDVGSRFTVLLPK